MDWLGEIPEGWDIRRIKDLGFLYSGLSGKNGDDFQVDKDDMSKPFIPFTNIANNTFIKTEDFKFVKIFENEKQNKVKKGDIFFLMSSENYEDIGKNSLLSDEVDEVYLNSFCKGFRFTTKNIYPQFINYLLLSKDFRSIMSLGGKGFIRINLSLSRVNNFQVIIPQKLEQIAITNYLDKHTALIDKKIELLKAKKQSYTQLKQALINEVVTKGLDTTVEMKDSGIEWIGQTPNHWEVKRGKDLFHYIKKINKHLECKNVLSLTYNGVINKDYETKVGLNPESYETYQFVDKDDLIFKLIDLENIKTSRVGIVHEHGIMSSAYIRLKSNRSFNKFFYYLYFYYYKINLFNYLGGGVRSTINFSTLLEIFIIIPPKSEQITIANYLDEKTSKIDQVIKKIDTNIFALQEFRKTLINDVVTGKVKVL